MAVDPRRTEAKKLSLEQGLTQAAIAQQLNVSTRTIERWASEDGWGARKKAQKVISIADAKPRPQQPASNTSPTPHRNPPAIRQDESHGDLDMIEQAIADVAAHMRSGENSGRDVSSLAGALVRLLEYRRKICPPTAAELAEQIIALGIQPSDLVAELKERWLQRA